jgi:diacylglycerol O-acyltransferase
VPLDIRDPRKLLQAVHRRTEFLKQAHAAEIVSLSAGFIGMLPTGLQAVIGPVLSQLPITPFNVVCTNVPGPQSPLYLLGHKMVRWYPYVPIGGEMSMNCAVLSYDGNIGFGFSGDVHAAPDLRRVEEFLQVSFEELREAAGLGPPRKKSSPKRRTTRVAKRARKSQPAPEPVISVPASGSLTLHAPSAETVKAEPAVARETVLATVA